MNHLINNKNLSIINFIIVIYFALVYLASIYKINFDLIIFVVELFSIPFLIAQVVFLFIGIRFLIKNKGELYTKVSLIVLAICTYLTLSSFF
jgi:hypothetical protein